MTTESTMDLASTSTQIRAELVWVGSGAWVAHDMDVGEHDPNRVVAYVECRQQHVDVTWVRGTPRTELFAGLREALRAIQRHDAH